jgi:excinuclease ABC subunit A
VVIEHNLDVVKSADWIIDLGPEGGDAGGTLITVGTPEDVAAHATSSTGHYLRRLLGAPPSKLVPVDEKVAATSKKTPCKALKKATTRQA